MAALVEAIEANFDTDFAILTASQRPGGGDSGMRFAVSGPGVISMMCGTKYADIAVRLERWDDHPPPVDGWEDSDELCFEPAAGAGPLMLSGFDPIDSGIDLDGLGQARAQVFARGRHRYSYSSATEPGGLPPEEWLIRVFPHAGPHQPLQGGPRRIAGSGGLARIVGNPFREAVLGYRSTGWADALVGSHGFYLANLALLTAASPSTRGALAAHMAQYMPPWEMGGLGADEIAVPPRPSLRDSVDPLAALTGRSSIATIGVAIDALVELGLLLVEVRHGDRLLIPNPAPEPAWNRLHLEGPALVNMRSRSLQNEADGVDADLAQAVRWAGPAGLTATPRTMAVRWSSPVSCVVSALRLLGGAGSITSDREMGFDAEFEADAAITLRSSAR